MNQFLSHPLSKNTTVAYGGCTNFSFTQTKKMGNGDTCNQMIWSFSNHLGTHIDCPFHFAITGKKINDYDASFWFFNNIHFTEIQLTEQIINYGAWCEEIPPNTDLLLLKTNFELYRFKEPRKYWEQGPGLSPELGKWLRGNRALRAIGFDFISVTSYQHRELGREAHRALLDPNNTGTPILPIEDMKLSEIYSSPSQVIVSPLIVENADGSPVTVFAKFL